jgi:hypothetical protein
MGCSSLIKKSKVLLALLANPLFPESYAKIDLGPAVARQDAEQIPNPEWAATADHKPSPQSPIPKRDIRKIATTIAS